VKAVVTAAGLLLSLACGAALAQATRLSDIIALARAADAQFAAARAATESAREKLPQARAGLLPSVSVSHSIRHNRDASTAYDGKFDYEGGSTALVVNQPLFRVANQVAVEQAELQVRQAEQQLAISEQDLLLRVARAYFDILQAADELSVATAQKDAFAQQLAQARRAFEVGTVPITDLNEAQARHDLAVAQEIGARNELASRSRVLERSIARPLPPLARLKDAGSVELLDEARQQDLVAAAPRDSLLVQAAATAVQVAAREIERRDLGHTPTLDFVGSLSVNRNTNFGTFGGTTIRQVSIGIEIALPIYQGGAISSRVREALADRQRLAEEQTQAERQALLDAQQAQLGVQSGVALTRALRQAVSSTESQVRSTTRGLQVGTRTRVDVLNAEQQLFAARKDLAAARYRTITSTLQLKAAAGALTSGDMFALDALLGD
jgi:outer membrane protein